MDKWVVISRKEPVCPWCEKVKDQLARKGIEYAEIYSSDFGIRFFLVHSGLTTVPQVFRNGRLIGGFEDTEYFLNYLKDAA